MKERGGEINAINYRLDKIEKILYGLYPPDPILIEDMYVDPRSWTCQQCCETSIYCDREECTDFVRLPSGLVYKRSDVEKMKGRDIVSRLKKLEESAPKNKKRKI